MLHWCQKMNNCKSKYNLQIMNLYIVNIYLNYLDIFMKKF